MNPDTTPDIFKVWVKIPTSMHEVRIRVTPREDHTLVEQVAMKLLNVQPLSPGLLANTLEIDERVCESILESLRFHGHVTYNESTGKYEPCDEDSLESSTDVYVSGYLHYSDITGDLLPDIELVDGIGPRVPGNELKASVPGGKPANVSPARIRDLSMSMRENPGEAKFANDEGDDVRVIHGLLQVDSGIAGGKPGTCYALVQAMPRAIDGEPIITVHRPIPMMGFDEGKHAPHDTIYRERLKSNYPVLWDEVEKRINEAARSWKRELDILIPPGDRPAAEKEAGDFLGSLGAEVGLNEELLSFLELSFAWDWLHNISYEAHARMAHSSKEFYKWQGTLGDLIEAWAGKLARKADSALSAIRDELEQTETNMSKREWKKKARSTVVNRLEPWKINLATSHSYAIGAVDLLLQGRFNQHGVGNNITAWVLGLADPRDKNRETASQIHESFSKNSTSFWEADLQTIMDIRNKGAHVKEAMDREQQEERERFLDKLVRKFEIDTPRGRLDLVRWVCEPIAASCRAYRDAMAEATHMQD